MKYELKIVSKLLQWLECYKIIPVCNKNAPVQGRVQEVFYELIF